MARKWMLITLCLLLAGCNLPTGEALDTATPDRLATEVSVLLAQAPTSTTAPAGPAVETAAPPSPEPSATLTQAPPPSPTDAPAPATPTAAPPAVVDDPPDWQDTLEGGKAFYQYENENTRVMQENGRLVLTGINANGWLGWSLTFSRKPANFRLEATFIPQACSGSDLYGLIFRAPNANAGYFYGVTCDGRYNLHVRDFENDTNTVLLNLTSGTGILTGANATNRLAVKAEGSKISLYANGTLLQEITDSTYSEGNYGAFVAANETPGFSVWMDEIALWNLP